MSRLPSLAKRFDNSIQSNQQAQKIEELQIEIERLRSAQSPNLEEELQKLREQLKQQSGEHEISLDLIDPNPNQPRQTIPLESILKMARSLEKDGQITPVILIPVGTRYLLWDGQRRWEGAKYLNRETIRAVFSPMPKDLHRKALLTFIHHEDLNPLDKAEAIVREIAETSQLHEHEIPKILSTVLRRLDRQRLTTQLSALVTVTLDEQKQGLIQLGLAEPEYQVLEVLLDLNLNPASVKANLVSILALPKDLKESIRNQGLKAAHALALAVLTGKTLKIEERQATRERIKVTQQVVEQDLSVKETRQLVSAIRSKYLNTEVSESKQIVLVMRNLERLNASVLSTAAIEQLEEVEQILAQKLADIRQLIKSSS